jgi:hypothetical protein
MVPDFDRIQSEHRDYRQRQEDSHSHWTDGDQSAHVAECYFVLERISEVVSTGQGTVVRWLAGGIEGVEAAI